MKLSGRQGWGSVVGMSKQTSIAPLVLLLLLLLLVR
jgi:hypothetical protein